MRQTRVLIRFRGVRGVAQVILGGSARSRLSLVWSNIRDPLRFCGSDRHLSGDCFKCFSGTGAADGVQGKDADADSGAGGSDAHCLRKVTTILAVQRTR